MPPVAAGHVAAGIAAEVAQDPEQRFGAVNAELALQACQIVRLAIGQQRLQPALQIQDHGGRFLARLHAWLVVGVDVHQLRIEAHRPLEQRHQGAEQAGIEAPQAERDALAPPFREGGAGALQEAVEVVARMFPMQGRHIAGVFEHFDKGDEEVVDAVTQLLHIGVLVGGALVAVHGDALVGGFTIAVEPFPQRLHHQLLQVAAEHLQAVAVGQHHHVPVAFAVAGHVPGRSHQGCRVGGELGHPGGHIHLGGTGQKAAQIGVDQGGRKQAHGTGDAGAAADPIEHVEAAQPALLHRQPVELAARHRDRHCLSGPAATQRLQPRPRLLHAQPRLRRAARFAHHHHQGGAQPLAEAGQGAAEPLRIDVVEEVKGQALPLLLQRPQDQQRPEAGTADADPQHIGEGCQARRLEVAGEHLLGEGFDAVDLLADVAADGGLRRQLRSPQPVVAHLAPFIRVGDRAGLQRVHGLERGGEGGGQRLEMLRGHRHAAHIQPHPQPFVVPEQRTEPLPLFRRSLGLEVWKRRHAPWWM